MIALSKRVADTTTIISALEADPKLRQLLVDPKATLEYIINQYNCSQELAEDALRHLQRGRQEDLRTALSNRTSQQKSITIPGTPSNPIPRQIPVEKLQVPAPAQNLSIDPVPANTPNEKVEDVVKPIVNEGQNRQQTVIDAIKACKVAHQTLAKAMYDVEMIADSEDDVMSKTIDAISQSMAKQTATTIKQLASPLIGAS